MASASNRTSNKPKNKIKNPWQTVWVCPSLVLTQPCGLSQFSILCPVGLCACKSPKATLPSQKEKKSPISKSSLITAASTHDQSLYPNMDLSHVSLTSTVVFIVFFNQSLPFSEVVNKVVPHLTTTTTKKKKKRTGFSSSCRRTILSWWLFSWGCGIQSLSSSSELWRKRTESGMLAWLLQLNY